MGERSWTNSDFGTLIQLYITGKNHADIGESLGRTAQAIATKSSRIGLNVMTQGELQQPGVAVRTCLNPVEAHPFVSTSIANRTCRDCKRMEVFRVVQ